nr:HepT-like ribonuclease domain-containing protein [uncultured Shinella sp.]
MFSPNRFEKNACVAKSNGIGSLPSKRPAKRLHDIIDNIDLIRDYTAGMDFDAFLADRKTMGATERCLLRISEASIKLDDFVEIQMPDIDWPGIRGLGNVIRHAYDQLEPRAVWAIVTDKLEPLLAATRETLARIEAE